MPSADSSSRSAAIAAVRSFNRLYTERIGILAERYAQTAFTLAQGRVLYELAQAGDTIANELVERLNLDPGYLSRIVGNFERAGLLRKRPAPGDRRRQILRLTRKGRAAFKTLDRKTHAGIAQILAPIRGGDLARLVEALGAVARILEPHDPDPYVVRTHRAGDMGMIVHRHGILYAEEYGWDETMEALIAEITAAFIRHYDPARERCWIAERDGSFAGCVLLLKESERVARLRCLLVEPDARGLGIGARLVDECIAFAKAAGYRTLTLWTNDVLTAARRLYERAGFKLRKEERHHSFGCDLTSQDWALEL